MKMTSMLALGVAALADQWKEPTPPLPAEVQRRKIADANNKRAKKAEKRARQAARNRG